jgi:hypothetical protein
VISYTSRPLYTSQLHSPATLHLSGSLSGHFTLVSIFLRPLYPSASLSGHSTPLSFFHRPVYPCQLHSPVTLPLSAPFSGLSIFVSFSRRSLYPCQLHYSATLPFLDSVYDHFTLSRLILRQLYLFQLPPFSSSLPVLFTHEKRTLITRRIRAWVDLRASLCSLDKRKLSRVFRESPTFPQFHSP